MVEVVEETEVKENPRRTSPSTLQRGKERIKEESHHHQKLAAENRTRKTRQSAEGSPGLPEEAVEEAESESPGQNGHQSLRNRLEDHSLTGVGGIVTPSPLELGAP